MLKIKTLNPKRSKLIKYINKNGLSQRAVAECLGISTQWFNTRLNEDDFNRRDESTIKTVVDKLVAKRK